MPLRGWASMLAPSLIIGLHQGMKLLQQVLLELYSRRNRACSTHAAHACRMFSGLADVSVVLLRMTIVLGP